MNSAPLIFLLKVVNWNLQNLIPVKFDFLLWGCLWPATLYYKNIYRSYFVIDWAPKTFSMKSNEIRNVKLFTLKRFSAPARNLSSLLISLLSLLLRVWSLPLTLWFVSILKLVDFRGSLSCKLN